MHNKVSNQSFVSFEQTKFHKGLDISNSNFWCDIQFWGIQFIKINYSDLAKNRLYNVSDKNLHPLKRIRETFRIIKQAFKSQGNIIDSLTYHRLEMETYKEETKELPFYNGNKIILCLNRVSNGFGLEWKTGVKFVFKSGLVFYIILHLLLLGELQWDFSSQAISEFVTNFFKLLNPTDWNTEMYGMKKEHSYVVLFFAKILIGYGYYQTIQAFRKYGKN